METSCEMWMGNADQSNTATGPTLSRPRHQGQNCCLNAWLAGGAYCGAFTATVSAAAGMDTLNEPPLTERSHTVASPITPIVTIARTSGELGRPGCSGVLSAGR